MDYNELHLASWDEFLKWAKCAQNEVIERFNLKPPAGYPNYPSYCFVKKNSNRYFRKHLGFVLNAKTNKLITNYVIIINDFKKTMVFRLKYGL